MKKVVLQLDVHDDKCKQRAMKMVSTIYGLDSISMDMKEKKLTITGDTDPVAIVRKLRKVYRTEIVSIGPLKEPEKKKDEPKKEEPKKKDEPKKDQPKESKNEAQAQMVETFKAYNYPIYPKHYYVRSVEEDPNGCVIC